jgi:hypothetical protein
VIGDTPVRRTYRFFKKKNSGAPGPNFEREGERAREGERERERERERESGGDANAMAEELEPLWLTAPLLRVP